MLLKWNLTHQKQNTKPYFLIYLRGFNFLLLICIFILLHFRKDPLIQKIQLIFTINPIEKYIMQMSSQIKSHRKILMNFFKYKIIIESEKKNYENY